MHPAGSECYLLVMRTWTDPIVASHAFFLANAALWVRAGSWVAGVVLLVSCCASVAHHRCHEENPLWEGVDYMAAIAALAYTLYLTLPLMTNGQLIEAGVLLFIAVLAKNTANTHSYRFWHTGWHILVALGQAYLALTYWTYTA